MAGWTRWWDIVVLGTLTAGCLIVIVVGVVMLATGTVAR
jgi:hypothetical protein